jgi:hypothetical protein
MLVKEFHYLTSPNAAVVAAFKSSANYYLVVISGREASLVRVSGDLESAEVIKNIESGPLQLRICGVEQGRRPLGGAYSGWGPWSFNPPTPPRRL